MRPVTKLDEVKFADPNDPTIRAIQGTAQACFDTMLSIAEHNDIQHATFCASVIGQLVGYFADVLRMTDAESADRFARQINTVLTRSAELRAINESLSEPRQ